MRNELKAILTSIKKSKKKSLKEGYAWERKPGQPLPTMEDVQSAHNKGKNIAEAIVANYGKKITVEQMLTANIRAFKSWCLENAINYKKLSKDQVLSIILTALTISADSEALAEALDVDFTEGMLGEYLRKLGVAPNDDTMYDD